MTKLLTDSKVINIRKRVSEGADIRELSEELRISYGGLTAIVAHRTWKHLTDYAPEKVIRLEPTEKDLAEMRPIKGYEDAYSVTPNGTVISNDRKVEYKQSGKIFYKTIKKRIVKSRSDDGGYPIVGLTIRGFQDTKAVHRLVADTYLPPPTEGQTQIRHKDGNKMNPHVDNLERGNAKENAQDRDRHGTTARGERHGMSKLSAVKIDEILAKKAKGVRRNAIATEYGVSLSSIDRIIYNPSRKHLLLSSGK